MSTGVSLQLFDGSTPQANLTGIQALWWDVTEPKDASRPVGKSSAVTTDASGFIKLDLSTVTGLGLGDFGFLMLYKLNASDAQDSLMFSGKVATSDVTGGVDMYYYDSGWRRPTGWLELPTVANTEEKVVGLYQILPDSNLIALTCAGAYTVNWGDGVTEDFATGVKAEHVYDYADADLNSTEITVDGLTYKQAIVTITPQAANNLTSVDFGVRPVSMTVSYATGWLDLLVSSPSLSTLVVGDLATLVRQSNLQQFQLISTNTIESFAYLFHYCHALESIPLLNTSSGTDFTGMFSRCSSIQSIPALNTSSVTSFALMFNSCSALRRVPMLDTSAGLSFSGMFGNCAIIQSIPLLSVGAGTDFSNMFSSCFSLQNIPLLNTEAGTTFTNMFSNCSSLSKAACAGTKLSIGYFNCKLSATALNEIYTNLATVTAKTINVTGNWGAASDNPSIATAKGWTVTG